MKQLKILIVVLALSAGCATAPSSLSPIGVRAFHASRVVSVLDVVRDTAIAAEASNPQMLSTDSTRLIVEWHRSAISAASAAASGWQGIALSSLNAVMQRLNPAERELLAPYVKLAVAILGEVR